MTAIITLKTGKEISVNNISLIKEFSIDQTTEITDFKEFAIFDGLYTFIGDNIVSVNGQDILAVNFF